ncbi:MAG: Gfo/Idh/MocA family protein [Phycisphaeraceae bacterium JB051]
MSHLTPGIIRVGQIGCNGVAHNHAKAHGWTGNTKLHAVCDINESLARSFAKQHQVENYFTSAKQLFECPDIDLIDLVTPDHTHASLAITAMQNGKHVLVEKPMATCTDDAKRMIEVARQNKVQLMCVQSMRWIPKCQDIVKRVHHGDIGQPVFARMHGGCPSFWRPEHWPQAASADEVDHLLVHNAMHSLDLLSWLLEDKPQNVYTVGHPGQKGVPLWEYFSINVRFTKGAMGLFEENRMMQPQGYSMPGTGLHVVGTEGTIVMSPSNDLSVSLFNKDGIHFPGSHMYMTPEEDNFAAMIRELADAIMQKKPVPVCPDFSRDVLAGVLAAVASFRSGQPVEVNHD